MIKIEIKSKEGLSLVERPYLTEQILCIGDTVSITLKNFKTNKKQIQIYTGIIIAKKNEYINTNIIVRKIVDKIEVEKHFFIYSPKIKSISILKSAKIRRAKLYYLRNLKGKASRLKQKF